VTRTGYASLRKLETLFRFVEPDSVVAQACGVGLELHRQSTEQLKSGKTFSVLQFTKAGPPGT
jgi:hypothetical protein